MTDEREDAEKSLEAQGAKPADHATFEEPTGSDAVIAREKETITDGGVAKPDEDTNEADAKP